MMTFLFCCTLLVLIVSKYYIYIIIFFTFSFNNINEEKVKIIDRIKIFIFQKGCNETQMIKYKIIFHYSPASLPTIKIFFVIY